ncbi:MAG: hypothetical protein AAFQ44_01350 [Pseudomonadota bacterium]
MAETRRLPSGRFSLVMEIWRVTFQSTVVQKKLEDAGFEPKLAHGLTAVLEQDIAASSDAKYVTRDYLDNRLGEMRSESKIEFAAVRSEITDVKEEVSELRSEVRTEISGLRSELRTEISGLRSELRTEISGLRSETKVEIAGLKAELLKWTFGMIAASTITILIAIIRLAD